MFPSKAAALNSVRDGTHSAALVLCTNFFLALIARFMNPLSPSVSADVIYNSTVHIYPDMTNQLEVATIYKDVVRSFEVVVKRQLEQSSRNTSALGMPVQLNEPIYGTLNQPYINFIAPGVVVMISFFGSLSLTVMRLVIEKKLGLIERSIVAGVSNFLILLAHFITNVFVILVQVTLLLVMVFVVFRIPFYGSIFWIGGLTIMQSLCGMAFGLMVSAVSDTENTATMLSLAALLPTMLLSGTIWPSEAMNDYLRYFSFTLPMTLPIRSMRSLVARGWDVTHWQVYSGFGVSLGWVCIFVLVSTLFMKYNRK